MKAFHWASAVLILLCATRIPGGGEIPGGEKHVYDFAGAGQLKDFVEAPVDGAVRYPHSTKPGAGGGPGKMLSTNRGEQGQTLHFSVGRCDIVAEPVKVEVKVQIGVDEEAYPGPTRIVLALSGGGRENLISSPGKLGMRLFRDIGTEDSDTPWRFQLVNGFSTRDIGEPFALESGHWYQMQGTFAASKDGKTVKFTISLQDFGTDGRTKKGLSRETTGTTPALDHYNIRDAAIGLLGQHASDGAVAFDEFMIVPAK